MSYLNNVYVLATGVIGSVVEFVQGNYQNAIFILVAMMVIDIVTGILKGAKNKRLKSAIMHLGIIKKAGMLLAILFASLLDILVNDSMPIFRTLMVWLAIGNEGLSIIENLSALGVHVPAQIKDRLAQVVQEKAELQKEKDGQ
jgi:toxin secretion/phage lysis holin